MGEASERVSAEKFTTLETFKSFGYIFLKLYQRNRSVTKVSGMSELKEAAAATSQRF